MNLSFLKSGEKRKIVRELEEKFGISNLSGILMETGKEKIRMFSGTMTREEIIELSYISNVEIIGIYLIKKERDLRLSFDATQVLAKQIKKEILEINDKQFEDWMLGKDLNVKIKRGVVVLKHNGDFIGCGVSNEEKIFNYVPKERRIRKS